MLTKTGSKTDWANMPLHEMFMGNCLDADYTLRLYHILQQQLELQGIDKVNQYLISPAVELFSKIEHRGMYVDTNRLDELDVELSDIIQDVSKQMAQIYPDALDRNLNSDKQLADFLYIDDLNKATDESIVGLYPTKMTKSGAPSTDKESIDDLLEFIDDELEERGEL